ncbi:XapX domain-containing protein [Cupriavidus respiraculi]|uniref:XapX domain-containing protein n=1 Tax=Cupriavidus respiraculi TaxID=195930 RepID=UPI001C9758E8|nr:XapX domain-containing protein [Cupriavidus respiraculi]MBY4947573.1 XapX domain-containing protein [Cupriavidus respiraculi]
MKLYLVSLGAGILVGVLYALMQVRSPAPPVVALVGLLGMLIGGQIVPPVQRLLAGEPVTMAWFGRECVPQITGLPPAAGSAADAAAAATTPADARPGRGATAPGTDDIGCKG